MVFEDLEDVFGYAIVGELLAAIFGLLNGGDVGANDEGELGFGDGCGGGMASGLVVAVWAKVTERSRARIGRMTDVATDA